MSPTADRPARALLARLLLALAAALLLLPRPAAAQGIACAPCAGVLLPGPEAAEALAAELGGRGVAPGSPVIVAWEVELGAADGGAAGEGESADPDPRGEEGGRAARAVRGAGATPWITLVFRTPPPLRERTAALDAEIAAASRLARRAGDGYYQVSWRPPGATAADDSAFPVADYAYLLKRAAVALSGAADGARVAAGPLPAEPAVLASFYGNDVAGYLEALTVVDPDAAELETAAAKLTELDPGRPLVVEGVALPEPPLGLLAEAARRTVHGAKLTLFDGRSWLANRRAAAAAASAAAAAATASAAAEPGEGGETIPPETGESGALPGVETTAGEAAAAESTAGQAPDPTDETAARAPTAADAGEPLADLAEALALLARDFAGDIAFDPYSVPTGADAWSFVRGSDLGLRVIIARPSGEPDQLALTFPDPQLRDPRREDPASGETVPLASVRRTADGVVVRLADPRPVEVLQLDRVAAAELGETGGIEERVEVASQREVPVEEILRRLQAFEDAQARRIDHYRATNTTSLRFGVGAGVQNFEATLQGPFFFDPATGTDWAWQTFYINGVKWRGDTIPEIPLVQPEKAAALPLEITFDKKYRYRLRGSETIDGRDAWVVDFEPAAPVPGAEDETADEAAGAAAAGGGRRAEPSSARISTLGRGGRSQTSLYRGTVWVDRRLYSRVRTRAVQLGLQGEVISNQETLYYTPIDAAGQPADWQPGSFVLPLRVVQQQLLSVVNATTLVERETRLTDLVINGPGFAERRAAVTASDVTMVRDTEEGLRYLVKQEGAEGRVVKEGFDTDKWFLVGGIFADDALDYPLPLGGVNYLSLDFRHTGSQLNVFFAGALLTANVAQPRLFGTRFDAGIDVFGLGIALGDTVYRDGEEVPAEEVEIRPASVAFKLGRPLGSFTKLSAEYRLVYRVFGRADDTADDFVLPADHLEHAFRLSGRYVRRGYSLGVHGGYSLRSGWEPWGRPIDGQLEPAIDDFTFWGASLGKNWYLPRFQKIGTEIDYVDGRDLDRFSKYSFGFFGDTRVHGYQSNKVVAERALLTHASYGFELGELIRLDALADVAWATDEASGLEDELLAGVGIAGTFVGPWRTVVNLDLGIPVAGPDDGFVAYLVFLKLFR